VTAHRDPLAAAENTAHVWLAAIAEGLGTDDRHRALRILRTWLHLVRDRLSVIGAVRLGAQLPALVRGVYYEDWVPNRQVGRCTATEFVDEFAHAADLEREEAAAALATVTSVLREHFSPGQLELVLVQLPRPLRTALGGQPRPAPAGIRAGA